MWWVQWIMLFPRAFLCSWVLFIIVVIGNNLWLFSVMSLYNVGCNSKVALGAAVRYFSARVDHRQSLWAVCCCSIRRSPCTLVSVTLHRHGLVTRFIQGSFHGECFSEVRSIGLIHSCLWIWSGPGFSLPLSLRPALPGKDAFHAYLKRCSYPLLNP